jgi:hypothetical protein
MTEKSGVAKTRSSNGQLQVYLQLNAGASCILQMSSTPVTGNRFPYYSKQGTPVNISGTWNLKFLEGGPSLPGATTLKTLQSWTTLPGEKGKSYSGTASYTTRFARPSAKTDAWLLDLGTVEESAEVFLNGKRIATLIGPAYEVLIPASVIQANNTLEVKVASGMVNRIIDLEKKGVQWKKFYNTNFPSRLPANRGSDGLFTAAKWEPVPSGLLGPVTISPVIYDK